MHTHYLYWRRLILAAMGCFVCAGLASAADDTTLTKDQIKQFLLTAKVVGSKHTGKGVTQPWRLTLSDGTITHDASFQAIDEHKTNMQFASGRSEMNFVDSYKYNIAAYSLAEIDWAGRHRARLCRTQMERRFRLAQLVATSENG